MNFLFAFDAAPFSERAATAGIVSLQGMVTIFLVLALLWGVVEILHKCFSKEKTSAPAEVKAETPTPAEESVSRDDGELVAVITAAIRASLSESGQNVGFRVVSFRKSK